MDFHLERTRREINKVSVNEVVERITNALRLLSIEAEFDGENAKAKCKTSTWLVSASDFSLANPKCKNLL